MGMFDYVRVSDPRFVCSEGHDLSNMEFQTKDFKCVLGFVIIEDGKLSYANGCLDVPPSTSPTTDYIRIGCVCERCPAFVQADTGNLCPLSVDFKIHVIKDIVQSIERISESTAEFLVNEPKRSWMIDCEGPMDYETARLRHISYPRK
jgi:hypothetical protein